MSTQSAAALSHVPATFTSLVHLGSVLQHLRTLDSYANYHQHSLWPYLRPYTLYDDIIQTPALPCCLWLRTHHQPLASLCSATHSLVLATATFGIAPRSMPTDIPGITLAPCLPLSSIRPQYLWPRTWSTSSCDVPCCVPPTVTCLGPHLGPCPWPLPALDPSAWKSG